MHDIVQAPRAGARLNPRELDILRLLADGLSNRGIAKQLCVSVKTVEVTLGSILRKLELPGDADANRRVRAATYFATAHERRAPTPAGSDDIAELLATQPFDTVATVLRQHATDGAEGGWTSAR